VKVKAFSDDILDVRFVYAQVAASYSAIASWTFWGHYSHANN